MRPLKPHLSHVRQLELLKSRGMAVEDEQQAILALQSAGYYRLSGYWYVLRQQTDAPARRHDQFEPGASFGFVWRLYDFDREFRLLMLSALERIEVAVRTQISYLLGSFDPEAHKKPTFFDGRFTAPQPKGRPSLYEQWREQVDKACDLAKDDFVDHHRRFYDGKMPVWVCSEVWNFGLVSKCYEGMRVKDAQRLADPYRLSAKEFASWLRALTFVRNVAAHHGRLWNRTLVNIPSLPSVERVPLLAHLSVDPHARNKLYCVLVLLAYLLRFLDGGMEWPARVKAVVAKFPAGTHLRLANAGFPAGWEQQAIWA